MTVPPGLLSSTNRVWSLMTGESLTAATRNVNVCVLITPPAPSLTVKLNASLVVSEPSWT